MCYHNGNSVKDRWKMKKFRFTQDQSNMYIIEDELFSHLD